MGLGTFRKYQTHDVSLVTGHHRGDIYSSVLLPQPDIQVEGGRRFIGRKVQRLLSSNQTSVVVSYFCNKWFSETSQRGTHSRRENTLTYVSHWIFTGLINRCIYILGLLGGANGKESACKCQRHKRRGFSPWVGKIPLRRQWQSTSVFLPANFHEQRSLRSYSPWFAKSQTELSINKHTHTGNFRILFLAIVGKSQVIPTWWIVLSAIADRHKPQGTLESTN